MLHLTPSSAQTQAGGAWYSVIKFRQKAARSDIAVDIRQSGSLPRYTAVSTRDEDATAPPSLQPICRNGSFRGFNAGGQRSPVQSPHALARQQMQLQLQQRVEQEHSELPSGVLIGGGAGGFSPRKLQSPWGGVVGAQVDGGGAELAAGGLADGAAGRSSSVSRRNSMS